MRISDLVQSVRTNAGLSLRALAGAAGVATSTVHRIERGELQPTIETLARIAEAAGVRLRVEPQLDHAASVVGLALSIRRDIAVDDTSLVVRKAAEFAHRYNRSDTGRRLRMITAEPPSTGDHRWDAFLAALVEWLAVRTGVGAPDWVHDDDRSLRHGWWITSIPSMRAWEYAGSAASFQQRGVYVHRDSLTNV